MTTNFLWLLALGPLALAFIGAIPSEIADRRPRQIVLASRAACLFALGVCIAGLAGVAWFGSLHTGTLGWAGIGISLYVDALTAIVLTLVAFVGVIVVRYSRNYLDGDAGQGRFHAHLCLTLAAVLGLVASGNLALAFACWVLVSVALHGLLVFYPERPSAVLAARKKFVTSRFGDICILIAMALVWRQFGSLDYATIFVGAKALGAADAAPASVHAIGLLLVSAALLKSAQFPAHGWLLEVMETPTPVSALLHAGVINAGGFLVLRFADLISLSPPSLGLLAVVGGFTALFGSAVMLTQTSVKVSLAYSTIAQMGFMMLECGLGAFSAAALHIVAHSLYKAHAFLASGSIVDVARASWTPDASRPRNALVCLLALATSVAVAAIIGKAFGAGPLENPGAFTLGAILALGLVHLAFQGQGAGIAVAGRVLGLVGIVSAACFALQFASAHVLSAALPQTHGQAGPLALALATLVVTSFAALALFQALLPGNETAPRWEALYALVSNGLYANTLANKWIIRLWPATPMIPSDGNKNLTQGAAQ